MEPSSDVAQKTRKNAPKISGTPIPLPLENLDFLFSFIVFSRNSYYLDLTVDTLDTRMNSKNQYVEL
jgi:hypothetical protein